MKTKMSRRFYAYWLLKIGQYFEKCQVSLPKIPKLRLWRSTLLTLGIVLALFVVHIPTAQAAGTTYTLKGTPASGATTIDATNFPTPNGTVNAVFTYDTNQDN